jgi:hypothetical protein
LICSKGSAPLGDRVEDLPLPLRRDSSADAVPAGRADIERADPGNGLDPHLGLRRVDAVAAAGADPQSTDPVEVDLVAGGQEVDGAPDVFDPRRRALGEVRFAAAFTLGTEPCRQS